MGSLVVTLIGPDRPGLVRAISDQAAAFGANWSDSLLANFAGQFAGIVHLQVAADKRQALREALPALDSPDLRVLVALADDAAPAQQRRTLKLELVGHDRPGIIHSISTRLADRGVSIDKMKTHIASGAMSGEQMFHLDAQLSAPPGLDPTTLRDALESLANELMVDISFEP